MIDTIKNELKEAMIAKDKVRIDALRNILPKLKMSEIDKKRSLSNEEVLKVIQSMSKKIKDSIKQFTDGGREDLANKEKAELEILKKYLPEPIKEDELRSIIESIINDLGATELSEMGKIIGLTINKTKGAADGNIISKIVREKLS